MDAVRHRAPRRRHQPAARAIAETTLSNARIGFLRAAIMRTAPAGASRFFERSIDRRVVTHVAAAPGPGGAERRDAI
jgi:hypothetical protein